MDPNAQQPEQPLAPQPAVQEKPQAVLTKSSLPLILLSVLGVVIVLGLIAGAYYLGTQKNAAIVSNGKTVVAIPTKTITSAPTVIATPTPDATVNWKTYTDASNGISIKYPEDWGYDKTFLTTANFVAFGQGSNYKVPLQTSVPPLIALTANGGNYDAKVKQTINNGIENQNQQAITVDGLSGIFVSGTDTQPGPGQGLSTGAFILDKNGLAIDLSYNIYPGNNITVDELKNIAQQMIYSLKVN